MILENYYQLEQDNIQVSRQQASDFAKSIASDFNPIHDPDSKRFCVPGDLLFALVLHRYGLNQHMKFTFSGMVGDQRSLHFPESEASVLHIKDDRDKEYLTVERSGEITRDNALIHQLTHKYVAFSGQTFPHILVPLMAEHQVMINPDRPLVIYESMEIDLDSIHLEDPMLELVDSNLEIRGKRALVTLKFGLTENGKHVGHGFKSMVLSGLRPYEEEKLSALVAMYEKRKQDFGT